MALSELKKSRMKRADEWKQFRGQFLFTQRRLADIVGISRRTIQQVEGAKITPHPDTLLLFEAFKMKHEANAEYEVTETWREELKEKRNG
jgi:DNA-binding XRE family transcriptional regulator